MAPPCCEKRAGHLHDRVFEPHTIRVAAGAAGKAIKVRKAPFHLAITPDGTTVYVVNSILPLTGARALGSVTPIRVATGTAGKPIRVGRFPLGIAIDP